MGLRFLIRWPRREYSKLFSLPRIIREYTPTIKDHPGRVVNLGGMELKYLGSSQAYVFGSYREGLLGRSGVNDHPNGAIHVRRNGATAK
jgi:hypothetical protein